MGKKRSAARRAAAPAPAPAPAATTSPVRPLDTRITPIATTPASDAEELLANHLPQPRISHEADAIHAPRAASPAQPTNDTSLGLEPATPDAHPATAVTIAMPQTHAAHAFPEPREPAPAVNAHTAPHTPIPACSAPATTADAAVDLATAVACIGPPDVYIMSPSHDFELAPTCDNPGRSVPVRWATSLDEIDDDLLAQIVEHAQKLERRKTHHPTSHDVPSTSTPPHLAKSTHEIDEALVEDICEEGRKEARRDARVDEHRREQAWKDGYEQGRWEGYREGLEVVRTEVSTHTRVDATVQVDDTGPPHPLSIDTTPCVHVSMQVGPPTAPPSLSDTTLSLRPRIHAGVQSDAPPHPSRADSRPPSPTGTSTIAPRIDTGVQSDARPDSFTSPADSYILRDVPSPAAFTSMRVDAGIQTDVPVPPELCTPYIHDTGPSRTLIPTPDAIHKNPTISNTSTSYNDLSLSNDTDMSFTTAHTHIPSFSWADEASSLPITTPAPLISPPPRDFSVLHSSSTRPFESLKRRARRSHPRPPRSSYRPQPSTPSSEPVITRRHPAGLRADRPTVIVSPIPHLVKLEVPPLDWQGDPHLQELGRVLRGLGWVQVS